MPTFRSKKGIKQTHQGRIQGGGIPGFLHHHPKKSSKKIKKKHTHKKQEKKKKKKKRASLLNPYNYDL
jgi:hypothetical protein